MVSAVNNLCYVLAGATSWGHALSSSTCMLCLFAGLKSPMNKACNLLAGVRTGNQHAPQHLHLQLCSFVVQTICLSLTSLLFCAAQMYHNFAIQITWQIWQVR